MRRVRHAILLSTLALLSILPATAAEPVRRVGLLSNGFAETRGQPSRWWDELAAVLAERGFRQGDKPTARADHLRVRLHGAPRLCPRLRL